MPSPSIAEFGAGLRRPALLAGLLLLAAGALYLWARPDLTRYIESSRVCYDRRGGPAAWQAAPDGQIRLPAHRERVSPLYWDLLLNSEDRRFYAHPGVDLPALLRAWRYNLRAGHIVSGGSTLAMQTVRLLEPRPRTLYHKLREAVGAVILTLRYGRRQVLTMYATLAPMGANLEGVTAGSWAWFGHGPEHLTPAEAALLVAIPRAPETMRPDRHPERARYYRREVLRLAVRAGAIDAAVMRPAEDEPLPVSLRPIPQPARLWGRELMARSSAPEIYTALDPEVQARLNAQGALILRQRDTPRSVAAVVLDNLTHEAVGVLGSGDERVSQLCLPLHPRSPGSTLKPFAYALAFEQGLLHPATIVNDAPVSYGTWQPRNFSGSFAGEVTAAYALAHSLNPPALAIIARVDPAWFLARLNRDRPRLILPPGAAPGAAVILGGCGISLYDLTALYAALRTDGRFFPVRQTADQAPGASVPLLAPEAARAVWDILATTPRPPGFAALRDVSYKTGTSHQGRDAWAVGSRDNLTVGVWSGRPDNRPVPGHSGYRDAAPLLFDLLQDLPRRPWAAAALPARGALRPQAPLHLRRLARAAAYTSALTPQLIVDFPPEGTAVSPDRRGAICLHVRGGTPPYRLQVTAAATEATCFLPPASGYYRISLTDSAGNSAGLNVKVQLRPLGSAAPKSAAAFGLR